ISPDHVAYELLEGTELELMHHGQPVTVTAGEAARHPIPPSPPTHQISQPAGREPLARRLRAEAAEHD
ncbi:MAG: Kojibiose phosphorylase, partial [Pseudonocardia sp.]|nr:Kojibiose phosphorylase [Pseudonocardia sp.]